MSEKLWGLENWVPERARKLVEREVSVAARISLLAAAKGGRRQDRAEEEGKRGRKEERKERKEREEGKEGKEGD